MYCNNCGDHCQKSYLKKKKRHRVKINENNNQLEHSEASNKDIEEGRKFSDTDLYFGVNLIYETPLPGVRDQEVRTFLSNPLYSLLPLVVSYLYFYL